MAKRTWTQYDLTEAQLRRLAQMATGQPHLAGTALSALERKGLVEERPPRCPNCGSETITVIHSYYTIEADHVLDVLTCDKGHESKRRDWGGVYQHSHWLTTNGRLAFNEARREGW